MSNFSKQEDGAVFDSDTGLLWSQTIADNLSYEESVVRISELGDGWRMPTFEELSSIVDGGKYNPSIDVNYFPDTTGDFYWTSTDSPINEGKKWIISFYGGGNAYGYPPGIKICTRAVKSIIPINAAN